MIEGRPCALDRGMPCVLAGYYGKGIGKDVVLTTKYLARPLAATKSEIRISKYETISNDKKLNAQNFT